MTPTSKIQWTDATWNPSTGCTQISPGCDNCYAKRITERFSGRGSFDVVKIHHDRLDRPLRMRKSKMIFVNSMSDLFHPDIPDTFIASAFAVMSLANWHIYQVLTKRHGRMRSLLRSAAFHQLVVDTRQRIIDHPTSRMTRPHRAAARATPMPWPLPNVWGGVSVEDQQRAALRIQTLIETPLAVRFLSCEPLLTQLDLERHNGQVTYWLSGRPDWGPPEQSGTGVELRDLVVYPHVDWVIVGGESGDQARPLDPDWVRVLRDQCAAAGVAFFCKQLGEAWALAHGNTDHKGGDPESWPEDLRVRQFPQLPTEAVYHA